LKKTIIATMVAASFASGAASAATVTFLDNATPTNPFPSSSLGVDSFLGTTFAGGTEFRVINPNTADPNDGSFSGGGQKSVVGATGIAWDFDAGGNLTSVTGGAATPGTLPAYLSQPANTGYADSAPGAWLNAPFLFPPPTGNFGFIAPTVGGPEDTTYGHATIDLTPGVDAFTIEIPDLTAQWANSVFTLGSDSGGITFNCTGALTGTGSCTAEHLITVPEDSAGFAGQYAQWDFDVQVTGVSTVPVPAAAWLFGSAILGLVGVGRRKKKAVI
jgi:hypothetical protein